MGTARNPNILIVCGATASGKSALALKLAKERGGVIINADSQQLYAELRILTARPSPEEEAQAPHRLYGILPATESASAGVWLRYAKMEIDWALSQGLTPILVGGTGMYLKALTEGIAHIPDVPPELRAQAKADLEAMGGEAFLARLQAIDPETRIRPSDTQRLIRAYEVWLATARPLTQWQRQGKEAPYPKERFEVIRVELPREELYVRIDRRARAMIEAGAVEEVRALLALRLPPDLPAMRIIGVPELREYLEGRAALEEAIALMQQHTRNYAKRQLTWFRHQLR